MTTVPAVHVSPELILGRRERGHVAQWLPPPEILREIPFSQRSNELNCLRYFQGYRPRRWGL